MGLDQAKIVANTKKYFETATKHGFMNDELTNFLGEEFIKAPASTMTSYHYAFEGGLIEYLLRVAFYAVRINNSLPEDERVDQASLLKVCLLHGIGKAKLYVPCESEWHRKNQGKMYKHNPNNPFTMVPDLSLWNLQHFGIQVTWNEYLGIRIHDGLYDDANKPYYIARSADAKMRNNLALILHHADHMAARIEYEQWASGTSAISKPTVSKPKATVKADLPINASKLFNDLFKD